MKRALRRIGPVLTGLLLALWAVACGGHEPPPGAPETSLTAPLGRAELLEIPRRVELFGTVEAERVSVVSTRVMAMVTAVHVQSGDWVETGELLLEIDPQAAQGQVSQAQGALAQAQAALALAQRNYERFQSLAATAAASELELDMARMQYEQAEGAVEQARGAVEAATSVAADSRVTAPFRGRVVERQVEVGDLAAPGRPLLRIESTAARRLALEVPETTVAEAALQPGDPVQVAIDSRSDLGVLEGQVVEMTPGADPRSHTFQVKVALPVPDLATGAAARAWVPTGQREAVVVPETAVLRQGGMHLVVVRDPEGRASSRVVTLGERLGEDRVEILSGLGGGEVVLLELTAVPPLGTQVKGEAP
jgi:RND family efflux transporter MFP subunit